MTRYKVTLNSDQVQEPLTSDEELKVLVEIVMNHLFDTNETRPEQPEDIVCRQSCQSASNFDPPSASKIDPSIIEQIRFDARTSSSCFLSR